MVLASFSFSETEALNMPLERLLFWAYIVEKINARLKSKTHA